MIKLLIGRSAECDICYDTIREISSKHAEIVIGDDGRMIFTDYSTNGSYVNGQLVHHSSVMVNYGANIVFPGNIALDWNYLADKIRSNQGGAQQQQQQQQQQPQYHQQQSGAMQQSSRPASPISELQEGVSFAQTISEGCSLGFRNSLSLIGASILYILTIWIPYINIGTTIAMQTLPLLYARGEAFNPVFIFGSRYRKMMGNYLLLSFLQGVVIICAMLFMYFPAIVMIFTFQLSTLFLLDKEQDPIAAMQSSSRVTYGSKWTMFGIYVVYMFCASLVMGIFIGLMALSTEVGAGLVIVVAILALLASIVIYSISIGILGSIWNQLKDK